MTSKIIGIRELSRNIKRISEAARRGRSFIVMRNTRPVFRIEPVTEPETKKKYMLDDLRTIRFRGGSRNLSKEIDQILYGGKI